MTQCSRCPRYARPKQRTCKECHATEMRIARAKKADRIKDMQKRLDHFEQREAKDESYGIQPRTKCPTCGGSGRWIKKILSTNFDLGFCWGCFGSGKLH